MYIFHELNELIFILNEKSMALLYFSQIDTLAK